MQNESNYISEQRIQKQHLLFLKMGLPFHENAHRVLLQTIYFQCSVRVVHIVPFTNTYVHTYVYFHFFLHTHKSE